GDKIIVKENYDGTEYIAQGLVTAVTASTGAVTVSSWDTGSTFPSGGYTVNATVFKWQREYWDLFDISPNDKDAITKINFRILDASQGFTFWLDDIKRAGPYLTDPSPSGDNVSSTDQRYMQYRIILSTTDTKVTPNVSQVTVNYTINNRPTGIFNSAAEKTDGSGKVDISIEVDDADLEDTKAKLEYTSDQTCSSGWVASPNVTL
ncbi:unnamed protein product, partial [marine sediment metagenome]